MRVFAFVGIDAFGLCCSLLCFVLFVFALLPVLVACFVGFDGYCLCCNVDIGSFVSTLCFVCCCFLLTLLFVFACVC